MTDHPEDDLPPLESDNPHLTNENKEPEEEDLGESLFVFRIDNFWMALPTGSIKEVTEIGPVHKIPGRTTDTILGITNVDGVLHLAFSLKALAQFPKFTEKENTLSQQVYPRAILFGFEKNDFVFSVDEVYGTTHIRENEFIPPAGDLPQSLTPFVNNAFIFKEKPVTLLSDERILESLNKEHL